MDIFRRLTNPTLKKLYRFVLKRLIGRFLDDDISVEQIDVRLGAGLVELTDLNIHVSALAELLPPGLSFRLARAHVGRLRVEISYSKLLTESLAVFLDDVLIEIEPQPPVSNLDEARLTGEGKDLTAATRDLLDGGDVADSCRRADSAEPAVMGHEEAKDGSRADTDQMGEAAERLDFLAQWIDQITSKVKVVVNRLTLRIASAEAQLERADAGERTSGDITSMPCLVFRCSYLRWCDETPEVSSFVADQSPPAGIDRAEGPGKGSGGALFVHKRLTLGLMTAELDNGQQTRKVEVLRAGGTGSVAIKHCRKPQLGSPGDVVLDVDVSLRHADVTLATNDCTRLCTLLAAYLTRAEEPTVDIATDVVAVGTKPIKPLFREDFWYFEGNSNNTSSDLNFDTLSSLLEQYADARARLAGAEGYGQGVFGTGSYLSLGQSDVFYDCEEGSDDVGGGGDARPDRHGSMKFRVRMAGLDVNLLLAQESMTPPRSSDSPSASLRFQMRRMSQTLLCEGKWMQSVAEVGTFVADWSGGSARDGRCVRVVEVVGAADASPSVQISCTAGAETTGAEIRRETDPVDGEEVSLTIDCLPVAAVLDPGLVRCLSNFVAQVRPPVGGKDAGGGNGQSMPVPSGGSVRDPRVVVALSMPELTVRIPADASACSSDAHAALVSSVRNGTSPVGWAHRREHADEVAPMLVLQVEGVVVRMASGSSRPQETVLECTRVACQLLLLLGSDRADDGSDGDGGVDGLIGLYFLEASRSSGGAPLKVEYGLVKDVRNPGQVDLARPGDTDLKFLHTWEPNDGVDSGLEDVPPSGSFGGGLPSDGCGAMEGVESSPRILFFVLPRLTVELSRLELVVLADVLAGFAPRSDGVADTSSPTDHIPGAEATPSDSLEVVVEARGATVVLHEAAAFAEDPGPHSFVLNLGGACLHVGGSEKSIEGNPAPLVTVSAGDVCVHETLRCSQSSRLHTSGGRRINGPILFLPGKSVSAYPMVEDLPPLGFVPVLYQTKWAKGTSPVAAELALGVSEPGTVFKTITATLNLYDVSLRHTVSSSWLPRLLGLVVGDVPAGRASSSRNCETGDGLGTNGIGDTGGSLTKMFITVFNGVVDYMPQSQGPGCSKWSPPPSGAAAGAPVGVSPPTEGRAVFPIGVLRVSSNMVAGAAMQGFKVVIRDIGLHMSNRVMDYCSEDVGLCRGALEARRGPLLAPMKTNFSSVQEFLESSHFVQIATLNFLDAFLRTRSQVVAPSDAFTAVELWMGVVHVYTCQDSLSTCQALLGEWWALVNEVRAATAVSVGVGKTGLPTSERQTARVSSGETQQGAPISLLDDVEQDAFLPGNSKGSPKVAEGKMDPDGSASMGNGVSGQLRKQSLVIEDYYCVAVDPSDARAESGLLLADVLDGSRQQEADAEDPTPGQVSSFLSEGEGPAQWLAAPKVDINHGDSLSMESADDTSDSEGGEEHEAQGAVSSPLQSGVSRRSNFGFSLPAPIEIELEDRHEPETESSEMKETGDTRRLGTEERDPSSPEPGSWRSEGTDTSSPGEEDLPGDRSPRRGAGQLEGRTLAGSPGVPDSLSRQNSSPIQEWEGSLSQTAGVSAVGVPEVPHDDQTAKISASTKLGPVQGEQQARWLRRDQGTPSDGTRAEAGIGRGASSHHSEDFRVYPHYVPIPTTAEATSLPFLSGDPLLALGHGLEKNAQGEAEIGGSRRIDQKLQFQLAIHDLSICWRLFKGRDWLGRNASEDRDRDRNRTSHQAGAGGDNRRPQRGSTRDPPSRGVAEGKVHGHERMRGDTDTDTSSTGEGGLKPRKVELLDALLENYQDEKGGHGHGGEAQIRRRTSRQPKVKLLNLPRESGSSRPGRRTGRDTSCMLEVVLEHSSLRLDSFHPGPPPSLLSNLLFSIKDLHASDTLTSSRPRKTLHHWRDDRRHPREFQHKMVTVRMTTRSPSNHFCPEGAPLGDEVMLKVRLLPIHLSFGQHTVDFLRSFSPPQVQAPPSAQDKQSTVIDHTAPAEDGAGPLFISCCDVGSFKVKIDYQPRTIKVGALQGGDYLELLNLFPLEGVHLTLQKLLLTGVSGWSGVTQLLLQSWVQDITSNQLHKFLAGTTAVRPLVTVGKGVADLVLLPVEQYRRDGRVFRGLRKGTQSFLRAITIETLHTSHRVASYISRTLDDIVTQPGAHASLRGLEYYDEQPTGVIDSLEHAYDALAKEVQVAAQTIIAIPYEDQEEVVGPHGRSYVRSVARALPVAVLRPVVGASEALSCTLLGFRNAMAPRMRKEEEMRWS